MSAPTLSDLHRFHRVVLLQARGKADLVERQIAVNARKPRFSLDQIENDRNVARELEECAGWIAQIINQERGVAA